MAGRLHRAAAIRAGLGAAAIIAMAACAQPGAPPAAADPLSRTFDSHDALAAAVLDGLARRDVPYLKALALTESEFRAHVWPALPASRPERNVPFDYAWGQMRQRSDGYLDGAVGRYGGRHLTLVRTGFTGETTSYGAFTVMRDSEVVAADETGRELVLRLYGAVMVADGRYKLFSYVADP